MLKSKDQLSKDFPNYIWEITRPKGHRFGDLGFPKAIRGMDEG